MIHALPTSQGGRLYQFGAHAVDGIGLSSFMCTVVTSLRLQNAAGTQAS